VRVVIDTNVLISGVISSSGPPAKIVNALLKGKLIPVMTEATFAELYDVVQRPRIRASFTQAGVDPGLFLEELRKLALVVTPQPSPEQIRDEKDRPFLEVMATNPPPRFLITGDKDFEHQRYHGVPVIAASLFVTAFDL